MLYVGIDVAKNKHDIAVVSSDGTIHIRHLTITNNIEGFIRLGSTLDNLVKATGETVQIALEDTGHYCYNIISFLREHHFTVFSYNPLIIKEFAKSTSLRKTKTDRKDAMTIARKLMTDVDKVHFQANPDMIELKYATRNVARVKKDLINQKTQYIRILDIIFPELVKVLGGKNEAVHTQYIHALLKAYPSPRELSRAHVRTHLPICFKTLLTAVMARKEPSRSAKQRNTLSVRTRLLCVSNYSRQLMKLPILRTVRPTLIKRSTS